MSIRAVILAGLLGSPLFAGALAAETNNLSLVDAAKLGDRAAVRSLLTGSAKKDVAGPAGTAALIWAGPMLGTMEPPKNFQDVLRRSPGPLRGEIPTPAAENPLRILFVTSAHNSLSQRCYIAHRRASASGTARTGIVPQCGLPFLGSSYSWVIAQHS